MHPGVCILMYITYHVQLGGPVLGSVQAVVQELQTELPALPLLSIVIDLLPLPIRHHCHEHYSINLLPLLISLVCNNLFVFFFVLLILSYYH